MERVSEVQGTSQSSAVEPERVELKKEFRKAQKIIMVAERVWGIGEPMSRGEMYHKPKYGQTNTVWVERGVEQPLKGQVLLYLGGATYKVAISAQAVRVVQEQALSLRSKDERG